ncbi:hypothetical protein [Denitratisoma oestradiolicum]|uniref:Uncharacterized protein n=1 Tax=Denitratisoma oestradiolicum TaxID=311182 RepID=A0A6S6Y3Q2_9PROT|nr:hypothetical protein [Denitratisoma oestradiolicum]TWO80135.1 hypothetical protein CBW56_11230 [Denitratisoma oestradiolicum]CAB1370027.1 conserved protein of unknown function [Denitratisoma oestradiolicum]
MKIDLRKIYRFDPVARQTDGGLPRGGDIYYECTECRHIVSSVSHLPAQCDCGNLSGGDGTITVNTPDKVNPLRGKLR